MIYSVSGKIANKTEKFVVLENRGIGYKIFSPENILDVLEIGQDAILYTYLHIREDIFDLYGFLNQEDKDFFEMLISVSGIGPKGALGILSVAPTRMLKSAILAEDSSIMTKVSGIGSKTAAKIVLELKSKIASSISKEDKESYLPEEIKSNMDVIDALIGLGYSQAKAREVLKDVPANLSTEEKIKHCLKRTAK